MFLDVKCQELTLNREELFVTRMKRNEARVAARYLIRKLTSVPATQLSQDYGQVSQAVVSKPSAGLNCVAKSSAVGNNGFRGWRSLCLRESSN